MIQLTVSIYSLHSLPMAYLDPGTGSFLLQLLIAGLLAVGVLLRLFWSRISKFFGKSKSRQSSDDIEDDEDDN